MIALALLAAISAETAVDAERAFAAMAQTEGQWAAFRAFAAPEGVMFVPEQVNAQEWLSGRADPPFAVMWWPGRSWVSCDGSLAVNSGPWTRPAGRMGGGYFTTVWARQPDGGWKWLLDHGDELPTPRPAGDAPEVRRATCSPAPAAIERDGASADGTLSYGFEVAPDGARRVRAWLWNGRSHEIVIDDAVEAPR